MHARDETHIERVRNVTGLLAEKSDGHNTDNTGDGDRSGAPNGDPRPAIRIADRVLRGLGKTTGRHPTTGAITEALDTIAQVLERPLADGRGPDAERRATMLLWRTMDERYWAPPGVLRDEAIRAAWRRAFSALSMRGPTGLARLFVAGLEFRTRAAALALGELLLGRNRADASSAMAIANMLPGRAAIACRASDLAPERTARLEPLRLAAIMHTAHCGSATERIGRELHRLTEPREALERGTTMAQALDADGLDGIACAIASNWPSFWAPCHEPVRHGARHLMLLCRSRTGTHTEDWNGSLDELDDEGFAASALGARIGEGGSANAIGRHVLDTPERRENAAWCSLLEGTADAINGHAPRPFEETVARLVAELRAAAGDKAESGAAGTLWERCSIRRSTTLSYARGCFASCRRVSCARITRIWRTGRGATARRASRRWLSATAP